MYLRQAKTSYKTIERAYGNIEVRQILEGVFELTNEPVADLEHEFGSDGTGLTTSCKQNYENGRQKIKLTKVTKKLWQWLVLSISLFHLLNTLLSLLFMSHFILSLY
ncbi:MAG: hypothetical protein FWH37_01710 [Candidatus Bathyarchaeota archaeon]|nr:hypothetical protein [Candidatus Termiticorpusculum sp.]